MIKLLVLSWKFLIVLATSFKESISKHLPLMKSVSDMPTYIPTESNYYVYVVEIVCVRIY